MQFTPLKMAIAVAWLLAVGALGVFLPVNTATEWISVIGFGFMPFVFMLRAWRRPTQSISQSIQAAIRK